MKVASSFSCPKSQPKSREFCQNEKVAAYRQTMSWLLEGQQLASANSML
jgi:hypothetical protein